MTAAADDQQQLTQSLLTDAETEALAHGLTNAVSGVWCVARVQLCPQTTPRLGSTD